MLGRQRNWLALGLVGGLGAAFASGCGDDFGSCRDSRTCDAASGGEAGDPGETGGLGIAGLGGVSGTEPGSGGDVGEAGSTTPGGASSGGAGGASETEGACADGYVDWFKSSFSFPNGDMIGTADFPSMPWVKTGSLKIDTGRLSGVGAAVTSQGVAIPYANARARFRARFTGSGQKVTTAFDAASNGSAGVRITVDSAGGLSLTEGTVLIGSTDFAPLETGVDWFVEAIFAETGAEISLARANYGTEKQAKIEATLSTASLQAQASGKTSAVELASPTGVVPAIDELFVATCGSPAPGYEPKFIDTFERANSSTLGKAELPADLAWSSSSTNIKIVDGALQTAGELKVATIPLQLSLTGLRIRTTVKVVVMTSGPSALWADVNVNVTQTSNGMPAQGFWFWGDGNSFYTGIFTGGGELKHDVALSGPEKYYVQMDRDADVAVVTVREQSFEGPILGAQFAGALLPNAEPGGFFSLGDEGGAGARFEDVRADNYAAP